MSNLVSTAWLTDNLHREDVVILDCTWHMPNLKRNAAQEFALEHISRAQFFDLDQHTDRSSSLPHMLPTAEQFAQMAEGFGISRKSHVVVYDSYGLFSAPRVWWTFKNFGHDKVSVLNGGFKKWLAEGRKIAVGVEPPPTKTVYHLAKNQNLSVTADHVALDHAQVVDARSATRFRGEEQEPRPGVLPGHIPGAHNVHYASLIKADGGLKSKSEIRSLFTSAQVDLTKPIITSCGSGVTAAILSLALTEIGVTDHKLYDGSWAEWGASGREIITG